MPRTLEFDATPIALGFLSLFNDSKIRWLNLVKNDPLRRSSLPSSSTGEKPPHPHIFSMSHPSFFRALDSSIDSSDVLICPKLETLVPHIDRKKGFDVQSIMNMTAASRGADSSLFRLRVEWNSCRCRW